MSAPEPAIHLRDVFRVHRTEQGDAAALQGVDLDVPHGQVLAVLGPSGAGKTTLMRVIAGLEVPSAGVARLHGVELSRLSPRRRAKARARLVGVVDQHYDAALQPDRTARGIVADGLLLLGAPRREALAAADALLERVGLAELAESRPPELSGGERQRVALAAALVHRPAVLLADEPAGELDATSVQVVYRLLRELAAEAGSTVVVVSHDPDVARIADRALVLRDGRVSEELGPPGEPRRIVVDDRGRLQLPAALIPPGGVRLAAVRPQDGGAALDWPVGTPPLRAEPVAPQAPPQPGPVVLEAAGVARGYGSGHTRRTVLEGVDLRVCAGELVVVAGRSGSGKSTLLRTLVGLERVEQGTVRLLGEGLETLDRAGAADLRRRSVAVVGQESGLTPFLSATENVVLALAVRGVPDAEAAERAARWLEAVQLTHRAAQPVERLSGGERQRVNLARALATGPELLVADEPTSRLDEDTSALVADLLLRAAREERAAVVVATHEELVAARADRLVAVGPDGRLVEYPAGARPAGVLRTVARS